MVQRVIACAKKWGFGFLMEKEHVPNDKDFSIPDEEKQASDNEVFTSSDPNFWDYVCPLQQVL
jgi:hypothetical protein